MKNKIKIKKIFLEKLFLTGTKKIMHPYMAIIYTSDDFMHFLCHVMIKYSINLIFPKTMETSYHANLWMEV